MSVEPTLNVIENHCPYGCQHSDLDERGYCVHLVGFTNDRKIYEPIVHVKRVPRENGIPVPGAEPELTGEVQVLGGKKHIQPVLSSDKLVNPEERQLDMGVYHMAKKWVSDRVYRKAPATSAKAS